MAMTLITTNTITSGTAASAFTSSIDSTYKLYIFKWYDVHCADDDRQFTFQGSTDGGSSYGITGTSTVFHADHYEDGTTGTAFGYQANVDVANATSYMNIAVSVTSPNDSSTAGELYLFNPSNTTYVKHWYSTSNLMGGAIDVVGPWSANYFTAGYLNTTSAVDAINFQFSSSSNMDTAVIKMYGVG